MDFFVSELKDFFNKNQFKKANWELIKNAILKDEDIISNKYGDRDYGTIFREILEKN
jgi:hypothetical protein